MKHALLTFCILLTAMAAQAAPITEAEARSNVWQFLNTKGKQKIKGARSLTLAHTIYKGCESQDNGSPMLYIFNVNGDNGFVVASADDVALPILAYGNEGGFSQDIPDNVQAWLQGYADQIAEARAGGVSSQRVERPAMTNRTSVDYMVKVQWDQTEPYNDLCVFDGNQCVTGCVATAMAQIMYYWGVSGRDGEKFRHGCQALDSYTTEESGYVVPALDAIDSFDWDAMDEGTVTPQSDAAKHAVAQLMRYCGQSAQMDYTTRSSGASIYDAIKGLRKFGYSSDMESIDCKTYDEWDKVLYKEMRLKRPVLLMIGIPGVMNHALVCDGYDAKNNSFHLNWGWSGDSDGYYVLSAIFPNFGTTAKSYHAIVRIIPPASTYGVLSPDGETFTLYYDNKRELRTGTVYENEDLQWSDALGVKAYEVLKIVIDKSFKNGEYSSFWFFNNFRNVREIEGLEYFDTFENTWMECMFGLCCQLRKLDLSHFDTSNVCGMSDMFYGCYLLEEIDLTSFDTSKVINMNNMFNSCYSLIELDLSNFVINIFENEDTCSTSGMLSGCSNLKKLHISPSMNLLCELNAQYGYSPACKGVGSEDYPCVIIAPSGFDFGTDTSSTFQWKGGWFHLPYPIGDINHDEQVNVTDVTLLVDYILNGVIDEWFPDDPVLFDSYFPRFYLGYDMEEADINHDRNVNITDVANLVEIILK